MTAPGAAQGRAALVVLWLAVAVPLGLLLGAARATESGLDDPDPAWQRPGFLDAGALPEPAPSLAEGIPGGGRAAVVFFVRPHGLGQLCRALSGHSLARHADLVVVVTSAGAGCDDARTLEDPSADVARAYGMRGPRDSGYPVGYAVVDGPGHIRYRTLDPSVADGLDEVETMVRAVG